MINASGDRGVLEGRWGTDFFDGVPPTHWNGSVDILRRWNKYYHHPVKYGQCWVFAAVMCTVLRCLGIPCRPVTNYESAHDTHGNLIIDEFYSDFGVKPKESHDSVWNFHVWVEGWMRRPDLQGNAVYDGWQVLDPTPQELSDGTEKEREAFKEAVRRTEKLKEPQPTPADSPPEISITIEEHTKPVNGKDIDLLIRLRSPTPRKLLLHANAQVMLYFGILESDIWNEEKPVQLLAGQELTVPFQIPFSKYGSHLQGNNSIKVTAIAEDKETDGEKYMAEANIVPEDPPLNITVTGNPVKFGDMMVEISFANPLPTALENCVITASGSGLIRRTVEAKLPLLGRGRMVLVQVPFTPYKAGTKMLLAEFDCDQFRDIQTSCKINIKPSGLA
ncbi:hypothetical protein GJAV_G00168840 [Gymnothorax javanicus]|nr:hypothetical protein GJAV_G00168840 [Gymnothorax javanicus]